MKAGPSLCWWRNGLAGDMTERFPAVFVSHGAPTLPIEASPAREFLSGLGKTFGILAMDAYRFDLGNVGAPAVV